LKIFQTKVSVLDATYILYIVQIFKWVSCSLRFESESDLDDH